MIWPIVIPAWAVGWAKRSVPNKLKARGLKVTRIARGLPAGGELEHVDGMTIAQALLDRRPA